MIETNRFCRVNCAAFQFNCEVRINDVALLSLPGRRNLSTAFNINEWLRAEENILSIDLTGTQPEALHAANIRIRIGLCAEPTTSDPAPLLEVEVSKDDVAQGILLRPFRTPPMPFGAYDEHLLEPIRMDDRDQLIAFRSAYEAYYHAMASKDVDAVLRFHEYRTAAYAQRYYETVAHRASELRNAVARSFADEFLLKRIPELEKPNLHMGGRLVTMDYADDGLPLTTFTGPEADYTRAYQAYWGRTAQGAFFIYR